MSDLARGLRALKRARTPDTGTQATGLAVDPDPPRATTMDGWFAQRGWTPAVFQRDTAAAFHAGDSGLVHAPTGSGKTVAVLLGLLEETLRERASLSGSSARAPRRADTAPATVIWLTPLRALARDTTQAIAGIAADLGLPWSVELRTGDTSSHRRQQQKRRLPTVLVTTPESLSLLLTRTETREHLAGLRLMVVDEWHELLSTKRGVQTELALARLRAWFPGSSCWGMSATIGNLDIALCALLGPGHRGRMIHADLPRDVSLTTLLPADAGRFPWAGHLGLSQLPAVVAAVERATSTLLFTNVRSQAERWFAAIRKARPDWADAMALHHGSLDRGLREMAEEGLRQGRLKLVVCTSSLDLGVDFAPVDQVIQIGSPKGISRLLQRAGRSGHRPGAASRLLGVPTHAFELVEFAAARSGLDERAVEPREPLSAPFDVLAQHLVTVALGGGFVADDLYAEIRTTWAYRDLGADAWRWTLDFAARGGAALQAYPRYRRIAEVDGRWIVPDAQVARLHRLSVGTITSDQAIAVRLGRGRHLGTVEESFIARLRPGDAFTFAGRALELVRVRDDAAWVRPARGRTAGVVQWMGGRLPLSSHLAQRVIARLGDADAGVLDGPEMRAVAPVLALQQRWSRLPAPGRVVIESTSTREGHQHSLFLFAGRLAHEGLAALIAWRLGRATPRTFTVVVNDYGIGLLSPVEHRIAPEEWRSVLSPDGVLDDLLQCLDAAGLARRRFRDIARVAGLVLTGVPGAAPRGRQLQASASLFFDVFTQHDPDNLLLLQARREVLAGQLEIERLRACLAGVAESELALVATARLTPLAFPLWAEFVYAQVSSEAWSERVSRMALDLEIAADQEQP